ncbi:putative poly polymerase 2 [Podospora australis]|uniref:Poly [ADP-ribose] polymerase n=1 Tax=Podospora australis TaxID=1536484 RepID=A0AAN7AG18_9PEZI|nr:putative poly polymerase 2 [Podospora australis]
MPPKRGKKAAAPAQPPLTGCKIALSGTFAGMTQAAVKAKAELVGATVSSSVTEDTTHLVASEADFSKGSAKVAKAQALNIPILSLEWLELCETNNAKPDEKDFVLGNGAAKTDTSKASHATSTTSKSRKRATPAADNASDSETSAPKPKRGRKAAAVKKEDKDIDMEDAEPEAEAEPEPEVKNGKGKAPKAVGDGQVIKNKSIVIPLDEGCHFPGATVYIDPAGVVYDASLNQTNASNNNNKFYRIQLLVQGSTYRTWTRWGRVGEFGQTQVPYDGHSLDEAMKMFEKKFKDKSGNSWANRGDNPKPKKYAFVERNYDDDNSDDEEAVAAAAKAKGKPEDWTPPKCTLDPAVEKLMTLIFDQQLFANTMTALNYDANKLPLGKLSKATITRGFQALKDLSALIDDQSLAQNYDLPYAEAVEHLSNTYYSLIPHAFGRNHPPIIKDQPAVKQEITLLESLSDMKDAALIMKMDKVGDDDVHPIDRQYEGLKMEEMTPLDQKSQEYSHLADYLMNTRGATHGHHYQIENIFRIERQGEKDRFDNSKFGKLNQNRRLLWHGSRTTNFGGILSQGLRIAPPEAPVNGYMFDKGIYLADMASKSANYCCSYQSNNTALLLLCEAELGDPMQELVHSSYNAATTAKQQGMISTWGKGRTGPLKWKDASCVEPSLKGVMMPDTTVAPGNTGVAGASLIYNEYIAYDVSQVRLRYLFRVKM